MKYFSKKRFTMRQVVGLLTVVFLGITVIAYAAVTVPNTFSSGTTISSGQVNANFTTLGNAMPAVKNNASTASCSVFASAVSANVLSLAVTPPADGYIILSADGMVEIGQTVAADNWIYFYLTTVSGGTSAHQVFHRTSTTAAMTWNANSLHITNVFPVTGGATTTFYLTAMRDPSGSNTIYTCYPGLTAIFVPTLLP